MPSWVCGWEWESDCIGSTGAEAGLGPHGRPGGAAFGLPEALLPRRRPPPELLDLRLPLPQCGQPIARRRGESGHQSTRLKQGAHALFRRGKTRHMLWL